MAFLHSMTGYGIATRAVTMSSDDTSLQAKASVSVELRSVNSRFIDLYFRVPDECRAFEGALREQLSAALVRGKIECRINVQRGDGGGMSSVALNQAVLQQLKTMQFAVAEAFPAAAPMSRGEVLRWPGLLTEPTMTQEALRDAILAAGTEALAQLLEARRREGTALKAMLMERIGAMRDIVKMLAPLVPQLVTQHQQKLSDKLMEALTATKADGTALSRDEIAERIRQEVVLYGIRIDVAEELSRLDAHLQETAHILDRGGAVGKRLDFMMQELNREANTLGSKAAAKELADASMQLKLLIEQMREQVQNLE